MLDHVGQVIVQNLQKGAYAPSIISQGQQEVGGSVQSGTSTVMLEISSEVRQGPTEESTKTLESFAEERIMEGNKCGHSGPTETFATSPGDEVSGRGGYLVGSNYSIDAMSGPVEGPGEESALTGTSTVKLEESSRMWHRPAGESTKKELECQWPRRAKQRCAAKGPKASRFGQGTCGA